MRPISIYLAKGCYRQDPKTLPCQEWSNKNAFWQMWAVSRLSSDMSIHIPVYGNIESDLSRTDRVTNRQKPEGPVFLSKRCFHTSHAGITKQIADVWEGLRRVMAAAYKHQREQRKSTRETPLQNEEEMQMPSETYWTNCYQSPGSNEHLWGSEAMGSSGLGQAKREHFASKILEASDLSLQVVQYLLAQHQHRNRIIGFERLFPWSGLYPLKKIEQLNFFFFREEN